MEHSERAVTGFYKEVIYKVRAGRKKLKGKSSCETSAESLAILPVQRGKEH